MSVIEVPLLFFHKTLARTFRALLDRDFRLLWTSSLAMSFGIQMQIVARGWLIYSLTNSPLALTWVMLSFMLPSVFFSIFGGVLADRFRKKRVMMVSQTLDVFATGTFGLIILFGEVSFSHFIYFGIFSGTVMSLSMPSRTTIIPEVVGQRLLVNAMALKTSVFNLARIAGPALAGILIAILAGGDTTSTFGVGIVFFVITLLYLVSIIQISRMEYQGKPTRKAKRSLTRDLTESYIYLKRNRVVVGLLVMGLVPLTFGFTATFLMPVFNVERLGGDASVLGFLLTAMGLGALSGSLTLARLGDIRNKGKTLFVSAYCWAGSLALFAWSGELWIACIFSAFTGLFGSIMGSLNMSVVQLSVRQAFRGRIMAISWALHGLMPLGMIPIGWLAEVVGIQYALTLSAFLLASSMYLIGLVFPELAQIQKGYDERRFQDELNPTDVEGARQNGTGDRYSAA